MWDLFTLLLVLYTALTLPMVLLVLPDDMMVPPAMEAIEIIMDVVFLLDIALNFNTCFVNAASELVTDRRMIARAYIGGWFALDCAGSLPISLFLLMTGDAGTAVVSGDTSTLQAAKLLKAPKLLRLGRLFKMLSRIEGAGDAVRILLLLGFLCLTVHFLACGLFALFAMDDGVWFLTQTDRDYGEVRNGRSKPAAPR